MVLETDVVLGTLLILSLHSLQPRELRELALRACRESVSVCTFVLVKSANLGVTWKENQPASALMHVCEGY
jgi:hypothetical protein